MSRLLSITTAAALTTATLMITAPSFAADFAEIRDGYSTEAFADADDRWRRITANRYADCSHYGDKTNTRLNVLVDGYLAIGAALDANDEAAAMTAAKRLSRAININGRFAECWDTISRREGVPREFRDMLDDI